MRPNTFIPCAVLEVIHPVPTAHSIEPETLIPVTIEVLLDTSPMFPIGLPLAMVARRIGSRITCCYELAFTVFLTMPPMALVCALLRSEFTEAMEAVAMELPFIALACCGTVQGAMAMPHTTPKLSLIVGLSIQLLMGKAEWLSSGVGGELAGFRSEGVRGDHGKVGDSAGLCLDPGSDSTGNDGASGSMEHSRVPCNGGSSSRRSVHCSQEHINY
mmetsp:Transcript_20802/g.37906  ORF Transcript_20802/g.37906 Transcript_20802/m.37906 type:complete len:216 (-) Transcript_20802:39-686(-)